MSIFRMYTGTDGQSHLEEQTLSAHPILAEARSAVHIQFQEIAAGTFVDWHPAPRRQYVIVLAGQLELGFKDGTTRRLNPGDAMLAEDTTGSGHTTRRSLRSRREVVNRGRAPIGSSSLFLTLTEPPRVQTRNLTGNDSHFAGGG